MMINEMGNVYGNMNSCIEYLIKSYNPEDNDVIRPKYESVPDSKPKFSNLGSKETQLDEEDESKGLGTKDSRDNVI